MHIPKPKACDQDWLEMSQTERGRLCAACNKEIVDFSRYSWSEIASYQSKNNNSVCGMYTDKQLKHWGTEVPSFSLRRPFLTTAAILSLATASVNAQPTDTLDSLRPTIIIQGHINHRTLEGDTFAAIGTQISLKNTSMGTYSDVNGNYTIDVSEYADSMEQLTLVFTYLGYKTEEFIVSAVQDTIIQYNVELIQSKEVTLSIFYVPEPTLRQKINWKVKKLFSRKKMRY